MVVYIHTHIYIIYIYIYIYTCVARRHRSRAMGVGVRSRTTHRLSPRGDASAAELARIAPVAGIQRFRPHLYIAV